MITHGDEERLIGDFAAISVQWSILSISESIAARAGRPFPHEPVRSLDAIHLASALEFLRLYPDLRVLSFDERILKNLGPLGIPAV